jgi:hypothetical protein
MSDVNEKDIEQAYHNAHGAKMQRVAKVCDDGVLERGLPKWPQMYTTGKPVTVEQAKEIIRRTDSFFYHGMGGNDRAFNERLAKRVGMPMYNYEMKEPEGGWRAFWQSCDEWRKRWGVIATEYVRNSWVSCAYIFGPHGWCHPDGTISFVDNVGKWPDVADIIDEWMTLAQAFPFIELAATLMDGEHCEDHIEPVVTILVKDGTVRAVKGDLKHHVPYPNPPRRKIDDVSAMLPLLGLANEHGVPTSWHDEWAIIARRLAQPAEGCLEMDAVYFRGSRGRQ